MNIIFDCDDVLIDLLTAWVKRLNKKCNTNYIKNDIRDWEMLKYFDISEEELIEPLLDPTIWDEVLPIEGAIQALRELSIDNNLFIATATDYRNFADKINKTIIKYFPFIPISNIIKCDNKSLLKADVIIDDNLSNLCGESKLKILFTQPHNQKFSDELLKEKNVHRSNSWEECLEIIKNI